MASSVKKIKTIANGKLLLFGEHTILYGYPALGIALSNYITCTYEPGTSKSGFIFNLSGINEHNKNKIYKEKLSNIIKIINNIRKNKENITPIELTGGTLTIDTDFPIGHGLGSSAALCAALAKMVSPSDAPFSQLWNLAHMLEHEFHGTPSGIDTGIALCGYEKRAKNRKNRNILFNYDHFDNIELTHPFKGRLISCTLDSSSSMTQLHAFEFSLPRFYILYGTLPRKKNTANLIAQLHNLTQPDHDTYDPKTKEHIDTIGGCASQAAQLCRERNPARPHKAHAIAQNTELLETFGTLMDTAHRHFQMLRLSTPELDQCLDIMRTHGALGAKLSGAGGGGAFFGIWLPSHRTHVDTAAAEIKKIFPSHQIWLNREMIS